MCAVCVVVCVRVRVHVCEHALSLKDKITSVQDIAICHCLYMVRPISHCLYMVKAKAMTTFWAMKS